MRAVVQRVCWASVEVDGACVGEIERGLVIFLGAEKEDEEKEVGYMLDKIIKLRVFEDPSGKMNHSLLDIGSDLLVVSQFTLLGDCRRGRRPSFTRAMEPVEARRLYNAFVERAKERVSHVATGKFQKQMQVRLENDGPVTLLVDSKRVF